jgi:hypothetical protein
VSGAVEEDSRPKGNSGAILELYRWLKSCDGEQSGLRRRDPMKTTIPGFSIFLLQALCILALFLAPSLMGSLGMTLR